MSLRVLVTGVGGFVGGHLYHRLRQDTGWQIATVSRGEAPAQARAHTRLDLLQASDAELDGLLRDVQVCYHIAGMAHHAAEQDPDGSALEAFNVTLSERLYRAAVRCGVARFVWLSSSKVLGDVSAEPLPVTAPYAPVGHYAQSKAQGERALHAAASAATAAAPALIIVRPPLVYGPGVGANFRSLIKIALSPWPLPLGRARAPRSFIAVANLCAGLQHCAAAPAGTYQLADVPPVSVAELLASLRRTANRSAGLLPAPVWLMRAGLQLLGRSAAYERLFCPLVLDTADSFARLQWQPPFTTQSQLQETVSWFRSQR